MRIFKPSVLVHFHITGDKVVRNEVQRFVFLIILILFIFLTCVSVSALKVERIHGIVFDGEGNPIPGATIALYASNGEFIDYTLSMDDGSFCFHVKDGIYFIVVTSKGYLAKRSEIFSFDGQNAIRKDFSLGSRPKSLPEKVKSFWPLITLIASLFTFLLGCLWEIQLEKRRRKSEDKIRYEERKDAIASTIFIPLQVSVLSVREHFRDIKNAIKNISNNNNLDKEMNEKIECLKRDVVELEAILQRILLENKLISYLQRNLREEFWKARDDVRWFSKWLKERDPDVVRPSFKDWSKGEKSEEISKITTSLDSLMADLDIIMARSKVFGQRQDYSWCL